MVEEDDNKEEYIKYWLDQKTHEEMSMMELPRSHYTSVKIFELCSCEGNADGYKPFDDCP